MPESRLTTLDAAALLRAAAEGIHVEVRALPGHLLSFHPAPGEWCVKEVLGHLIEAERRGFAGRIRILLEENEPTLQAWDQNAVAHARRDCERDAGTLLGEFMRMREESARLVHDLSGATLARGGLHPKVGRLTVSDVMHEWIYHDRNHLRQMLENVRAFLWPALGNAQKFSTE